MITKAKYPPWGKKRKRNLYKHKIKITFHCSLCTLYWLWNLICDKSPNIFLTKYYFRSSYKYPLSNSQSFQKIKILLCLLQNRNESFIQQYFFSLSRKTQHIFVHKLYAHVCSKQGYFTSPTLSYPVIALVFPQEKKRLNDQ